MPKIKFTKQVTTLMKMPNNKMPIIALSQMVKQSLVVNKIYNGQIKIEQAINQINAAKNNLHGATKLQNDKNAANQAIAQWDL